MFMFLVRDKVCRMDAIYFQLKVDDRILNLPEFFKCEILCIRRGKFWPILLNILNILLYFELGILEICQAQF